MNTKYMGLFDFLFKRNRDPIHNDPVKEEYERALYRYNQALAINDTDPNIWDKKCFVLIQLGRFEEAIDAGKIGVQLAPNDPELWDTLHDAYISSNNLEKADECWKNVLNLIKQKRGTDSQGSLENPSRGRKGPRKKCNCCGINVSEIIQCGPCGRYFCPDCWRDHQWVHGKSPSIGISYTADGSFSGFDGDERIRYNK
ncbi:MAG: tetratricopeptide repeat protein [Methanoregula sp.]|nr:tetratricopeptide repeat protein [Methanoregula sp.]